MRRKLVVRCLACLLTLALSQAAFSYEASLSERSVREAYFLGQRNDEKTGAFFASYIRRLPLPTKGPHVFEIELLTPYAQVARLSQRRTVGYSAQQAKEDYRARGDIVEVRVLIRFTPTFTYAAAQKMMESAIPRKGSAVDFWTKFTYRLRQADEVIPEKFLAARPTFERGGEEGSGGMDGAEVFIKYDAAAVKSREAEFEVLTPDGQTAVAKFDLEKLR